MRLADLPYKRRTEVEKIYRVSVIRTYLVERGIGISWFLRQTGATPTSFRKIESGARQPPGTYRAAASMALGEHEDNLVGKVEAGSRDEIEIVRDEVDPRRITEIHRLERHGPNTVRKLVWELAKAPWVSRR
jgi:hypothetical protein